MKITNAGELQVTGNGVIKNQESGGNYSYLQQTSSDARLYVQYSQPLLLGTAATERMRIAADGNVGIGTTSPDKLFSVQGSNAEIVINDNDGSPSPLLRFRENGTTSATIKTDTDLIFSVATDEEMRITSGGDVGIGVSPSTRLHVSYPAVGQSGSAVTSLSTTQATDLGVKLSFTGGDNSNGNIIGGIALGNGGEEYAGIYAVVDGGSSAATDLALFAGDTNGINEAIRIDSSGNVGIGTTSPSYKLEIDGTADFGNTTTYNDGAAGLISWNAGTKFKIKGQSAITH